MVKIFSTIKCQVDTKTTARTAKIMPNPCLIVIVSFKKNIARITLKMGYKADSGAMIETGPFETAKRKQILCGLT